MSRRNRRRPVRGRSRSTTGGANRTTLVLGLVISVMVLGGAWLWWSRPPTVGRDEVTLCPSDPALIPVVHTVLLERNSRWIARTGEFAPMDPNTIQEIAKHLLREVASLPKFSQVVVHEVSYDRETIFEPVASICNPGDGSDGNIVFSNPALAQEEYRDRYLQPFRTILHERGGWSKDHAYSLWDALDRVAGLIFGDPALAHAGRSLSVVSDFIVPENFGAKSLRTRSNAELTEAPPAPTFRSPGFGGAEVKMVYVRKRYRDTPDIQGEEHLGWWTRYFTDRDAVVTEVHHVGLGE